MPITYNITPAEFGWLSKAFPSKNIISPFTAFEKYASEFSEQEKEELISQGVIGPDGTIQPSALTALNVLAEADGFSRIKIMGTTAPVEKVTYFKGDAACSVDSGEGSFSVTFPAMITEAGFSLEEFTGSSRLVNIPFQASLSPKASLAFLALADLTRAANLCALAGEPREVVFGTNAIAVKANAGDSLMWFVSSLKSLTGTASLSEGEAVAAVKELTEKKLAEEKDGGIVLAGDALDLAATFLIPEYVFSIGYGRMVSESTCEQSEGYVIFCGMHNLLYMDTEGEQIIIETMSGSELLNILANALQGMGTR